MRIELTRVGLLVYLANHYTTRGAQPQHCWGQFEYLAEFWGIKETAPLTKTISYNRREKTNKLAQKEYEQ